MTTTGGSLEKELFLEALELSEEERRPFLRRRCGSNVELLERLERYLTLEQDAPRRFLGGEAGAALLLRPGSVIGRFEVVRVLGQGGMGTVFEARQESPRRQVALKVVRQGAASPDSIRRIRREAEVLASLHHPGIAQVFDAGSATVSDTDGVEREVPFFAMELVRGLPLASYVEEHALTRRQRVELIARVCDAVHHAHQRGIIHRDLKSDNVLVVREEPPADREGQRPEPSPSERVGQPKVLDFGVARVIDSEGERTFETRAGDLIGSLSTMSTEQVSGHPHEVDVRSDVYALGVMLHQVLTGRMPLVLDGLSVAQAIERIRSEVPRPLSEHDPSLAGDLEVLVARALEKDASRRIESASELAAELRRHLAGAPIRARADSAIYVLRKTLRNHWAWSAIAGTVLLALIAVAIVSTVHSTRTARLSVQLTDQLEVATVERGRLYTEQDDFMHAAELLWPAFMESPGSRYARWGLWELYSRTPILGSWRTHESDVGQIAFHPNGRTLASVGWDGRVFLVDEQGARVVRHEPHRQRSAHFSPDGELFAVAGDDGLVDVYAHPNLERLHELRVSEGTATYVRFHPDGRLYTGGAFGELRVWEARSGELLEDLPGHEQAVYCIAFSADGSELATGGRDPYLLVWSASEGAPIVRIDAAHRPAEALAFSPDGSTLVSGGRDKRLRMFELPYGRALGELEAANGYIEDMTFHPHEPGTLVTGGWWATLFWDVASGRVERRLGVGSQSLAVHPSGRVAAHYTHELRLIDDLRRGAEPLGAQVERATCEAAPVGDLVATADEVGHVQLWDARSAERGATFQVDRERVRSLSFDAVATRLAVGCESDRARVFDLVSGEELLVLEPHTEISAASVALSPDGALVAHTFQRRVRVVEVDSGHVVFDQEVDSRQALAVAFHPDGTRLATTGRDGQAVRSWRLADGAMERELELASTPWCLAFSPGGERLAVTSWDKSVLLIDCERWEVEATLADHNAVVWDVAFHPTDPSLLASASDDGTVKLWDLEERKRLATLQDYGEREAFAVAFSADGEMLLSAGRRAAVLRSLSYFDRHVAGNVAFYLDKLGGEDTLKRAQVEAWASEVLARPWPPVDW